MISKKNDHFLEWFGRRNMGKKERKKIAFFQKDSLFLTFASVTNDRNVEFCKFLSKVDVPLLGQKNKEDSHELAQHSRLGLKTEF